MADAIEVKTITLEAAKRVAEGAVAAAADQGAAIVAVVINAFGQVVVVHRMDNVVELALENAAAKANAALTFKRSTRALSDYFHEDDSLGPPMTARGSILAVEGGELLTDGDGAVIGAIGVSGSKHVIDQAIANAGVQALVGS
jgi:glc operon protein GlcG